jgi:two-component system sensor histidine kinase/response regulator
MGCVLVVDDRKDDRDLLATVIGHMGHRVLEAPNGHTALELTRAQQPDLVITDLLMPAMNGYEFVRDLRTDHRVGDTPVIFCTANYLEEEVRALAAACDVAGFLPKPCEPQAIISVVEDALGKSANGSAPSPPVGRGFDREQLRVVNDKLVQKVRELEAANAELARTTVSLQRSNDDLEQFAYVASHDLSEPIRSVSGMVQLLDRRYHGRLGRDADEFITRAVDESKRMQALIHDLLEYSRVGHGEPRREPVEVGALVAQVVESLRDPIQAAGAEIATRALPVVHADPVQLRQVFQNLVANAIKFRSEAAPRIHIGAVRDGGAWRFAVADNGIGIAARHATRVFEVFKRLHAHDRYSGSGIGLSICKRIVERHGGRIWVEQAGGAGTTFQFTIPDPKEAHDDGDARPPQHPAGRGQP